MKKIFIILFALVFTGLTFFKGSAQSPMTEAEIRDAEMQRLLDEAMSSRDARGNLVAPARNVSPAVVVEEQAQPAVTITVRDSDPLPEMPMIPQTSEPVAPAQTEQQSLDEILGAIGIPQSEIENVEVSSEPKLSGQTGSQSLQDIFGSLGEEQVARTTNSELAPAPVIAPAGNPNDLVSVNFPNMAFDQALDYYADLTGRILLRQSVVPGAPSELYMVFDDLTKVEAVEAFNAVFGMNNIALLPVDEKFLRVVPTNQAPQTGVRFDPRETSELTETGGFVRKFVQLQNADVAEVAQILAPFASVQAGGTAVTALESNQVLILQDYAPNVKRMMEIVEKVDLEVPLDVDLELIPIKYALAEDIGQVLGSLTANGAVTVTGGGGSQLSSLSGRSSSSSGLAGDRTVQQASTAVANQSNFQNRLRSIVNRAADGDFQILGDAKLIPDLRSNSILVFANKRDMRMIKEIISKLDVVQSQVLIETVIMEVTLGDDMDFGVSYLQREQQFGDVSTVGWLNNASGNPFPFPVDPATTAASLSGGFTYLANINDDLNVAVSAIASNRETHILQRPRIQTFHAKEAHLFVGRSEPFVTSRNYGGSYTANSSNITREQIGIDLTVLPLVNPEGLVVLEINQVIEDVIGSRAIPDLGDVPVTAKREAHASVAVRSGETIILGGIIENKSGTTKSGLPFLKDIPILGALFSRTVNDDTRTELIILLRPVVLETPTIASATAEEELNKMSGVRHAEMEILEENRKRDEKLQKDLERYDSDPNNPLRNLE